MKKRGRKQYSADLKAKIAVEAVKGQRTIQEIASRYEVHPNMVTKWKKQVLDGVSEIFSNGRVQVSEADEQLQAELYQQIGKLQVEVERLKKSRDFPVRATTTMDRIESRRVEHRRAVSVDRSIPVRALLHTGGRERREHCVDAPVGRAIYANPVKRGSAYDPLAGDARPDGECEASAATDAANGAGSNLSQTAVVDTGPRTSGLSLPAAGAEDRSPRHGLGHRYHVYPTPAGIHLSGSDHGLVQPLRPGLGSVHLNGQRILRVGTGLGADQRATGDLQHRSGCAIHQQCVHEPTGSSGHHDQHGRTGSVLGQHLRRTLMAHSQVRGGVSQRLPQRSRGGLEPEHIFQVLQSGMRPSGVRLSDARGGVFSERVRGLWKLTRLWKSLHNADSHTRLKTASTTRLFHSSHRGDDGININPFQRQRSTLRNAISCPKNGERLNHRNRFLYIKLTSSQLCPRLPVVDTVRSPGQCGSDRTLTSSPPREILKSK